MTAYFQLISSYITNFISQMGYLGDHIGSYPGIIFLLSFMVILGALGFLYKLFNL